MIKDLRIKKGFTLVELLVVMSILAIMVAIVSATLNPIALVNKARDSRRKNDLNKIKIAFEAYFANKGSYPTTDEVSGVSGWNKRENCNKEISQMKSYLRTLPCDPKGTPYEIIIINSKTFKIITNLENTKDIDIPNGWYLDSAPYGYRDRKNDINYGVSSSNILWYEFSGIIDPTCGLDCIISVDGSGCVPTNYCVSGGTTLCFIGKCFGNNLGVPLPGILETTPQCYVSRCCSGSGCTP